MEVFFTTYLDLLTIGPLFLTSMTFSFTVSSILIYNLIYDFSIAKTDLHTYMVDGLLLSFSSYIV